MSRIIFKLFSTYKHKEAKPIFKKIVKKYFKQLIRDFLKL